MDDKKKIKILTSFVNEGKLMRKYKDITDVIEMADSLQGKNEFKEYIRNLADGYVHMQDGIDPDSQMFVFRRALLVSVDDGEGYDQILEIYSKLWAAFLKRTDLSIEKYKLDYPDMSEIKPQYTLRHVALEMYSEIEMSVLQSPMLKVFCLNISDWIDKTDVDAFRAILARTRNYMNNNFIVFRIPAVDEPTLQKVKESISWFMNVDEVFCPPESQDDYFEYGIGCLKAKDIELDDGAKEIFRELIEQAKKKPDFWGYKTIERITEDITIRALWGSKGEMLWS